MTHQVSSRNYKCTEEIFSAIDVGNLTTGAPSPPPRRHSWDISYLRDSANLWDLNDLQQLSRQVSSPEYVTCENIFSCMSFENMYRRSTSFLFSPFHNGIKIKRLVWISFTWKVFFRMLSSPWLESPFSRSFKISVRLWAEIPKNLRQKYNVTLLLQYWYVAEDSASWENLPSSNPA